MSREGRKRLAVDIPWYLFKKVEYMAKKRNITITKFVMRALSVSVIKEEL